MKIRVMQHLAASVAFSLCTATVFDCAAAEWNTFKRPSASIRSTTQQSASPLQFGATIHSVAAQNTAEQLPMPDAEPLPPAPASSNAPAFPPAAELRMPASPTRDPSLAAPLSVSAPTSDGCQTCETCQPTVAAPVARPISPWFGGAGLLFWNVSGGNDNPLVTYDNGVTVVRNADLNPSSTVGIDIHAGRYLCCGKYGLDFGYMFWDPSAYSRTITDGGAGLRFINPALTTVSIDRGGGPSTVYADFDTNAAAMEISRDMRIQGFEANLTCFGLMGARRLGSCSPGPIFGGKFAKYAHHGRGYYGGATGPLARAACGRLRVQNSHGFRWFQLEDELQIAGNVDGTPGYQGTDLYYQNQTKNDLFGYQFGSRLSYCLGCRTLLNIGGKIGVYGNNAEFSHRITTDSAMAYTNSQGAGSGDICTESSDVSVAGLGELDLGLGYRLSNRWTVNSGYRVLAAMGVATATGQMPTQYTTAASAGSVRADDCLILHGAYVGLDYNW